MYFLSRITSLQKLSLTINKHAPGMYLCMRILTLIAMRKESKGNNNNCVFLVPKLTCHSVPVSRTLKIRIIVLLTVCVCIDAVPWPFRTEELLNGIVKLAEDDVISGLAKTSKSLKQPVTASAGPPKVQYRRKVPLHSSKSSPHLFSNSSQNNNNNSNKNINSKPTSPVTSKRFTCKLKTLCFAFDLMADL